MTNNRRITLDELCPCGRRKYALMVPTFAFGREGGSYAIAERGCRGCGRMDEIEDQP
jgi:hypothetical protein